MNDRGHFFSDNFRQAQQRLRSAALRMGIYARHYVHPLRGVDGEPLGTDVYLVGNPLAPRILAIESGTHGVEGYAGSAIQLALFEEILPNFRSADTAVLVIHAVNPFGFSWRRRGDEQNIDLNRNFVDFANPNATRNDLFELLAPHLLPDRWTEEAIRDADLAMETLRMKHGADVVSRALRRGQYSHPGSVFFGGKGPAWSRVTVEKIAEEYLASAASILLLDIHTGLGSMGDLQLLSVESATNPVFEKLRRFFGPRLRSTADPSSGAANASGNIFSGYARCLGAGRFVGVALEFGTFDQPRIQRVLRADAWAYLADGDPARTDFREQSRREMFEAFCPRDSEWRNVIVKEGIDAYQNALAMLAER